VVDAEGHTRQKVGGAEAFGIHGEDYMTGDGRRPLTLALSLREWGHVVCGHPSSLSIHKLITCQVLAARQPDFETVGV
jgi:hypothetical protein